MLLEAGADARTCSGALLRLVVGRGWEDIADMLRAAGAQAS